MASMKYRFGLLLIAAVVIIWVASAEVTQYIFEKYRHPFVLTWLGASLLSVYLPISYLKDAIAPYFNRCTAAAGKVAHEKISPSSSASSIFGSASPKISPLSPTKRAVPLRKEVEMSMHHKANGRDLDLDIEEDEPLIPLDGHDGLRADEPTEQMSTQEIIRCAFVLAPMWLLTEYLSNAALSMTSVASTTILSSTSGLFTLLFGVSMGEDTLTMPKVVAVLVSIAGVIMTELGKTSARDDNEVFGDGLSNPGDVGGSYALPGHNVIGDLLGLCSAISYGFYTTLLRKYIGGEEGKDEKADVQKAFGYIGLVTLLGLWWLVFPLNLIGWEPALAMPSSKGLDEDILANSLVGSVISDYFWALSVVWTTPLVATLGLSLTIPLAMFGDMFLHGRSYSWVYVLGSLQVFAGFLIANLSDQCRERHASKERHPPKESSSALSDKEFD